MVVRCTTIIVSKAITIAILIIKIKPQGLCSNGSVKYPLLRTLNKALSKKEKGEESEPEEEVGKKNFLCLNFQSTLCRPATQRTTPTRCPSQQPRTPGTELEWVSQNREMLTQPQQPLSLLEPRQCVSSLTNQTPTSLIVPR